jgi:hypothetical protein
MISSGWLRPASRLHSEPTVSQRGSIAAFLCLGVGLGAAGCFFVQPINSPPQARIDKDTPGPHYRGDRLQFSAHRSGDPDGELLRADWRAFTCSPDGNACDAPSFANTPDALLGQKFEFDIPAFRQSSGQATSLILITVTVTDTRGAQHQDQLYVDVLNRAPSLDLQVQGFRSPSGSGYPVGTSVQILAASQDPDGDDVTLDWRLYPAQGSVPANVRWERVSDTTYELEPDIAGLWTVEVTASDGLGGTVTLTEPILIQADALPCIGTTEPVAPTQGRYVLDRDGTPRRFAVLSVRDDLDVYPPPPAHLQPPMGTAGFRWFVATPDRQELVELDGHDVSDLLVDTSAYAPGDRLTLRVEIDDRVGRDVICAPTSPTCSLGGDTCLQRVTWEVEVR